MVRLQLPRFRLDHRADPHAVQFVLVESGRDRAARGHQAGRLHARLF